MSRKFGGKRGLNPHEAFVEKLRYSLQSHTNLNQSTKHVRDFNVGELIFYGRIDTKQNFVIPSEKFISTINSQNSQVQKIKAVDFVADAVNAMNGQIRKMLLTNGYGKLNFSGFEGARSKKAVGIETKQDYKTLTFKKGFISPIEEYEIYSKKMAKLIANTVINNKTALRIKDFDSFIRVVFPVIIACSRETPITFLRFLKSTQLTSINSGLAVEFGVENFEDDQTKEDELLSDPGYGTLVEVARQYGFFVDKNRPNRLIADLGSPIMMQYAANRGLTTQKNIFDNRYNIIRNENYRYFKSFVYKVYSALRVNTRIPQISKLQFEQLLSNKLNETMLSFYVEVRKQEEFTIFNIDENHLRTKMKEQNNSDFITFIEGQLKNLPREPYSLSNLLQRGRTNVISNTR